MKQSELTPETMKRGGRMKTAIQMLAFGIVGFVLSTAGIGYYDWQFYAVIVMMAINGPRQGD